MPFSYRGSLSEILALHSEYGERIEGPQGLVAVRSKLLYDPTNHKVPTSAFPLTDTLTQATLARYQSLSDAIRNFYERVRWLTIATFQKYGSTEASWQRATPSLSGRECFRVTLSTIYKVEFSCNNRVNTLEVNIVGNKSFFRTHRQQIKAIGISLFPGSSSYRENILFPNSGVLTKGPGQKGLENCLATEEEQTPAAIREAMHALLQALRT